MRHVLISLFLLSRKITWHMEKVASNKVQSRKIGNGLQRRISTHCNLWAASTSFFFSHSILSSRNANKIRTDDGFLVEKQSRWSYSNGGVTLALPAPKPIAIKRNTCIHKHFATHRVPFRFASYSRLQIVCVQKVCTGSSDKSMIRSREFYVIIQPHGSFHPIRIDLVDGGGFIVCLSYWF